MKSAKIIIGLLFSALFLAALVSPAAAWETTHWVEGGSNGYMINNIILEADTIGVSTDDNGTVSGNVSLSLWEWKNDDWTRVNGTRLSLNGTWSFNTTDGNYTVKVIDLRETRWNEAKLEIWTNANVTNSGYITGGHGNATGAGRPNLVITKVVTPTENISVGDIISVTVYVHNTGNYDAKNVNINEYFDNDAHRNFQMLATTVNNTVNQTINKNTNNTYLVYQLKVVETGDNKKLPVSTATAENSLGVKYDYSQANSVAINVSDLAALTFTSSPMSGNTVDYYTRSKIDGTIVVRNTGTMPAQFISVEFMLPENAIISGKDIIVNGNKATVYIDYLTPNNERTIHYSLSAAAEGYYEVTAGYNYTYNNSTKTGGLETVVFRAVGSNTISKILDNWYLLLIPLILIALVAVFFLKRHNEYRF
ncbi:MAG: hypothetical protein FWE78_05480 [Methanimicrococcus sp.]|nr:hypothetical protein [Methanimicrococcus sp.]